VITDQKKISQNFSRHFFCFEILGTNPKIFQKMASTQSYNSHYCWSCNQLLVSNDVFLMKILEMKRNLENDVLKRPKVKLWCWTCNQLLVLTRVCMHIKCMSTDSLIMSRLYVLELVKSMSKSSKMGYFNWTKHSILKNTSFLFESSIFEIQNYTLENFFAVNF